MRGDKLQLRPEKGKSKFCPMQNCLSLLYLLFVSFCQSPMTPAIHARPVKVYSLSRLTEIKRSEFVVVGK